MQYGLNWFKGCRDLFEECVREGHPHDYFVFTIIVARARFNGNLGDLEIGQAFIGLDELGKLVRASRKEVRSSLKRLHSKGTVRAQVRDGLGTVVTILNSTFYSHVQDSNGTAMAQLGATNIDKIRKEKNTVYGNKPNTNSCSWNTYIEQYKYKYNKTPTWNKNNEKWCRELDALCPESDMKYVMEHFFSDQREYYKKVRYPLYALLKDFDQHRVVEESKKERSWIAPEGEYL